MGVKRFNPQEFSSYPNSAKQNYCSAKAKAYHMARVQSKDS